MTTATYSTAEAAAFADYLDHLATDCDEAGLEGNAEDHRTSASYIRWLLLEWDGQR